jgi:peptide/nickel transport system permease protein
MTTITLTQPEIYQPSRLTLLLRYLRRNTGLAIGSLILLLLVIFTLYGLATADLTNAYPISVKRTTSQLGISAR